MQTFKLLIVCMFCSLSSFGQMNVMWDKSVGDTTISNPFPFNHVYFIAATTDTSNNIYTARSYVGIGFDTAIIVEKRDPLGNIVWQNSITDGLDAVFPPGYFYFGTATLFTDYQQNLYLVNAAEMQDTGSATIFDCLWTKMDLNGNITSQHFLRYGADGHWPIQHDDSGNAYLLNIHGVADSFGYTKINAAGNIAYTAQHAFQIGDEGSFEPAGIHVNNNTVYLAGTSSTTWPAASYATHAAYNASTGALLWEYHDSNDTIAGFYEMATNNGMLNGDHLAASVGPFIRKFDQNGNHLADIYPQPLYNAGQITPISFDAYGNLVSKEVCTDNGQSFYGLVKHHNSGNVMGSAFLNRCNILGSNNYTQQVIDTHTISFDLNCPFLNTSAAPVPTLWRFGNNMQLADSVQMPPMAGYERNFYFMIHDKNKKLIVGMSTYCADPNICPQGIVFLSMAKIDDPILSLPFVQLPTDIEHAAINQASNLSVYPNPATEGIVHINWTEADHNGMSVELIDMVGRCLWKGNVYTGKHTVDLKALQIPHGIYNVRVNNGLMSESTRFVY